MPIYCYKCCECGNKIEVIQKVGDTAVQECNECSGTMEKIISPVSVIFKGSGFHKNDYKSEGRRREEKPVDSSTDVSADASADKSGDASADKSGDTSADKSGDTSADASPAPKTNASPGAAKTVEKKNSSTKGSTRQVA